MAGAAAHAETPASAPEEALTVWQWYQDIKLAGPGRYDDFVITPTVFDKAREDLADLRLRDAKGNEVPYALRIRSQEEKHIDVKTREFNHLRQADHSDELSLDLGEAPVIHNEIVLATSGNNFRRAVRIEGSDRPDQNWKTLVEAATIIRFNLDAKLLADNRVHYPVSRFAICGFEFSPTRGLSTTLRPL